MSVEVDGGSLSTLGNTLHLNKLRSLRFGTKLNFEMTWFSLLSNILFLSLRGCKLEGLPESICELSSLRYLDISHSHIKELPAKFWCLYSLQVVDARHSRLTTIHQDVTKLTNLRQLALPVKASVSLAKIPGLGNVFPSELELFYSCKKEWGISRAEWHESAQRNAMYQIYSCWEQHEGGC